jgi:hypothetical protein
MTELDLEREREAFEKATGFSSGNYDRAPSGAYYEDRVDNLWQGWLAARRASVAAEPQTAVSDTMKTWPERIWLQSENEDGTGTCAYGGARDVTWCEDSISRFDVEYVRADVAHQPVLSRPDAGTGDVVEDEDQFIPLCLDLMDAKGKGSDAIKEASAALEAYVIRERELSFYKGYDEGRTDERTERAPAAVPPVVEPTVDSLKHRAEGRAEALKIILDLDPETGLDDHLESHASFDGEYSPVWNEKKLRELLRVDDASFALFDKTESLYWEYEGKRTEAEHAINFAANMPGHAAVRAALEKAGEFGLLHDLCATPASVGGPDLSKLTRYDMVTGTVYHGPDEIGEATDMEDHPEGEYVRYADVQALLATKPGDLTDTNDPSHPRFVAGFKAGHKAGRARGVAAHGTANVSDKPDSHQSVSDKPSQDALFDKSSDSGPMLDTASNGTSQDAPASVDAWEYSFIHSSATGKGDTEVGPCLTYDKAQAFGVGCIKQHHVSVIKSKAAGEGEGGK